MNKEIQKETKLHVFQQEILKECLKKKSGGMSVPMGSGKTLISLELAQKLSKGKGKVLIVASKSLVGSWETEINKWFPDLKYQILNLSEGFNQDAKFYLTTPTTLVRFYKEHEIQSLFTEDVRGEENNLNYLGYRGYNGRIGRREFGAMIKHYRHLTEPLLNFDDIPIVEDRPNPSFYSIPFDVMIVDEAHAYLNIETERCRSICSIYAKYRWLLSGTLFAEPKPCNVLGFHKMIGDNNFPDNLPEAASRVKSSYYKGVERFLVHRKENEMFINKPKLTKEIITYNLPSFEAKVYQIFKKVINAVYGELHKAKVLGNRERVKNLNANLLGMILSLRLSIVAPVIPLSRIFLSVIDFKGESVNNTIQKELRKEGILDELNNESNLVSTRLNKTLDLVHKHSDKRIVIFSTFRTVLSFVERILTQSRNCYVLLPSHNIKRRQQILEEYSQDPSGILLLTYELGSDGLNLQFASVVIVLDVWWNEAKTRQALARVYRYGQTNEVNVYMFRSNTYIEHAMFKKHREKASIADQLLTGPVSSSVTKIPLREIVNLMNFTSSDLDDAMKCI